MDCSDIIKEYLKRNGYDGLCNDECGCRLGDLFPCGDQFSRCEPGISVPCDCGDCDFHIGPGKPAEIDAGRASPLKEVMGQLGDKDTPTRST